MLTDRGFSFRCDLRWISSHRLNEFMQSTNENLSPTWNRVAIIKPCLGDQRSHHLLTHQDDTSSDTSQSDISKNTKGARHVRRTPLEKNSRGCFPTMLSYLISFPWWNNREDSISLSRIQICQKAFCGSPVSGWLLMCIRSFHLLFNWVPMIWFSQQMIWSPTGRGDGQPAEDTEDTLRWSQGVKWD